MGSKYTKGQTKAMAKYMQDKHTFRVVVTNEKADQYRAAAEAAGKSINQFIIDCIEKTFKESYRNVQSRLTS